MIGLCAQYLLKERGCVDNPRLLEIDETEVVPGVGVGGLELEFCLKFLGGFRPALPANISLSGKVVSFPQGGIGL